MKLVYLASPYSDTDPTTETLRYFDACESAGKLMQQGFAVFSPVSHSHGIARACNVDGGYESWREQDEEMIRRCDVVVLLLADGADKSVGMLAESRFAMDIGKPVRVWDGVSKLDIGDAEKSEPCSMPCHRCIREFDIKDEGTGLPLNLVRMIGCEHCGNKRCPHASDHRLACTRSNEHGQAGSVYGQRA